MKIKEAESKLGNTAEEVAETLLRENCNGFRNSPHWSTLAVYFKKHCKIWSFSEVQLHGIVHRDPQIMDYYFLKPVKEFAERFEACEFPELALNLST